MEPEQYVERWAEALARAVEAMTGERTASEAKPASEPPPDDALWWEQPVAPGPDGIIWAGASRAAWLELGGHVLRSAGIEPANDVDCSNTCVELFSQAGGAFAKNLDANRGAQAPPGDGKQAPPPDFLGLFEVKLSWGQSGAVTVYFRSGRIQPHAPAAAPPEATAVAVVPAPQPEPPQPEPAPQSTKGLDLLMDVELPVSVSFGRAQVPLKDVLKLTTGSIVELNRAISEPVEVIVNNCVIARGEVVVVDGNYGVRIQEIISRERRLRTLR
jgi:flagellar motor switch protein FliN/FliY